RVGAGYPSFVRPAGSRVHGNVRLGKVARDPRGRRVRSPDAERDDTLRIDVGAATPEKRRGRSFATVGIRAVGASVEGRIPTARRAWRRRGRVAGGGGATERRDREQRHRT